MSKAFTNSLFGDSLNIQRDGIASTNMITIIMLRFFKKSDAKPPTIPPFFFFLNFIIYRTIYSKISFFNSSFSFLKIHYRIQNQKMVVIDIK